MLGSPHSRVDRLTGDRRETGREPGGEESFEIHGTPIDVRGKRVDRVGKERSTGGIDPPGRSMTQRRSSERRRRSLKVCMRTR
ncbi:hypothetical protein Abr02nite_60200 [Paractinoplanes brasiliensis]|nr:hypothetical protein Abr02nite_60200 [Actinoplanes brasiliensis]